MKPISRPFLRLITVSLCLLALSGCLPPLPTLKPTLTRIVKEPTLTPAPLFTDTPQPRPTQTPIPTPAFEPKTLRLGDPVQIGRGQIVDALFLPGAKQVAIAWGGGVSLNAVGSGQELWFQATSTNLLAFDLDPQGKMLAAALADGSVVLFDAASGAPKRIQAAQPGATAADIAWAPDGKTLAFQFAGPSRGDPISLLDTSNELTTPVPNTAVDPQAAPALVWSPDGATLTLAAAGGACPSVVDAHSGEVRMALGSPGHCYASQPMAWLPDGSLLAVAGLNGGVDLLRYPDGNAARFLFSPGETGAYPGETRAFFTDPGGKWFAYRGGGGLQGNNSSRPLIVWDLASGGALSQIADELIPLANRRRVAAAFSGNNIYILYESGEITRWAFTGPAAPETILAQVRGMPAAPGSLRWSADGSRLALTGRYGGVDVWDTASEQLVRHFDPPENSPALSPDGSKVTLFDPLKKVETLYDLASGQPIRILDAAPVLTGAAFSRDGHFLAYGAQRGVRLADMDSVQVVTLEPAPADQVTPDMPAARLAWSPDGQALAAAFAPAGLVAAAPGVIVLWKRNANGAFDEVYHAASNQAISGQPGGVLAVFNPSGSRAAFQVNLEASGGQAGLVVYDLVLEKAILTLPGYTPGAWINDNEILAANPEGGLERINAASGSVRTGAGNGRLNAYAPSGAFYMHEAASGARGIVIMNWQESDGTKIEARGAFDAALLDYGWSPDGRWAAAIGADGTLRIWPVTLN